MNENELITNVSLNEFASAIQYEKDLSSDIIATVISPEVKINVRDSKIKYTIKIFGIIVIIVTKGEMTISVDYKTYRLRSGSMIHIMPEHVITFMGRSPETTALCLMVSPDFLRLNVGEREIERNHPDVSHYIFLKNNPQIKLSSSEMKSVTTEFNRIRQSIERSGFLKRQITRNAMFGFLLEITQILYSKTDIQEHRITKRKDALYEDFLNILNREIRSRHDVEYYASKLCVTPQYLTSTLRHVSGKSTREWIEEMLIVEAKKLMNSKKHSIQEIANILNFKDQSTFGKLFKRKTGIAPSKYIVK